ncbi:MAG: hypothetical protein H0V40_07875, partial [Actinobacteria bacterium]|nr:hypothetical protein [Actinomycetota bacterium]
MNAEGLQTRRRIIERPRLTRLLDQSKARIIMLVAPAGYGKTTLARQWLAQENRRAAWYIGGPASADVAALAVGVADAAAQIVPGAGARVHRLLSATHSAEDDVDSLAQLLVEDLRDWPSGAWLVFDDYHFLSGHVPAERFVEHLVSSMPLRVMLTSRTRPSWSSARRLIYGEATQLGGPLLAMDSQEAAQLLADKPQAEVSALVAMADGWPAVLALAALREEAILPAQGVPSALFSYLADEFYQAIPPALRRDVTTLALIPSITVETTTHAIGQNASLVLSTCSSLGILTREDDETFGLHPLLRTFFQHKFDPQDERSNLAVTRLLSYFTTKLLWDDAFTLLQAYPDKAAIVSLVHAAMDDLLYNNRLSTLERWLSWAEREGFASPILSLAGAEVAVRQAMFANSEAMALEASRGLDQADPLLARALLIAGRAALLNSREGTALAHLDAARRAASNEDTLREVFWNLFVCALELESDAAESYFAQHERLVRGSPDDHIRLMAGRAHLAGRLGGVKQHLLSPTEAVDLVERVRDPIIRSSFLIRHSYMLVFCGRYEEALDLSAQHLDNLDEIRLTFPIPHALVVRAAAQLGIGDVDSCTASLDEARERIRARGDGYIEMNCRILEAKALAAQQDFRRALLTVPDGMPT